MAEKWTAKWKYNYNAPSFVYQVEPPDPTVCRTVCVSSQEDWSQPLRDGNGTHEWANLAGAGGTWDSGLTPVLLSLTEVWNTWALRGMLSSVRPCTGCLGTGKLRDEALNARLGSVAFIQQTLESMKVSEQRSYVGLCFFFPFIGSQIPLTSNMYMLMTRKRAGRIHIGDRGGKFWDGEVGKGRFPLFIQYLIWFEYFTVRICALITFTI